MRSFQSMCGETLPCRVVQERLGHAGIGITLDIYSHVTPAMQADAAELVAAAVFDG
jgi:integrase